eukprot:1083602-Pyramimonas_sp.AAC.1
MSGAPRGGQMRRLASWFWDVGSSPRSPRSRSRGAARATPSRSSQSGEASFSEVLAELEKEPSFLFPVPLSVVESWVPVPSLSRS